MEGTVGSAHRPDSPEVQYPYPIYRCSINRDYILLQKHASDNGDANDLLYVVVPLFSTFRDPEMERLKTAHLKQNQVVTGHELQLYYKVEFEVEEVK